MTDSRYCIVKKDSPLTLLEGRELWDVEILIKLLYSDDLLQTVEWENPTGYKLSFHNEREQMEWVLTGLMKDKYKKKYGRIGNPTISKKTLAIMYSQKDSIFKEHLKVKYKFNAKREIGRVYPIGSLGFCTTRREIRHTLCRSRYFDVDIENCHPAIFDQAFNSNIPYPYPILHDYVKDREKFFDLMNLHFGGVFDWRDSSCIKDGFKRLFIRVLYRGGYKKWLEAFATEMKEKLDIEISLDTPIPVFFTGMTIEFGTISKLIMDANPELSAEILADKKARKPNQDYYNVEGAILSWFAQDIERRMLEIIYDTGVCKKYIRTTKKDANFVFCYDGIMIPADTLPETKHREYLGSCEDNIKARLGFDIKLKIKGFDEPFDPISYAFDIPLPEDIDDEEEQNVEESLPEIFDVLKVKNTNEAIHKLNTMFPCNIERTSEEKLALFKKYLYAGVLNEEEGAQKLVLIYPYIKWCKGVLYIYDFESGLWSVDSTVLNMIISRHGKYLNATYIDSEGQLQKKGTDTYSNKINLRSALLGYVKQYSTDNGWMQDKEHSSLGKILFQNGYYDFEKTKFYSKEEYGFNPEILFFGRIHDDYIKPTEDTYRTMDSISQRLFINPLGEEQGTMLILCLARALSGIPQKKIMFGIGSKGNNGKSLLCMALKNALYDYVDGFDIKNFIQTENDTRDGGQMMRWAMLLKHTRIITSNENKSNSKKSSKQKLGVEVIKSVTGGDDLKGRKHSGDETSFIPHFIPFCFANDKANFDGEIPNLFERLWVFSFDKKYVSNPMNEFELKADPGILHEIKTTDFKRGLTHLLLQVFADYNHIITSDPPSMIEAKSNWGLGAENATDTPFKSFLQDFKITGNKDDFYASWKVDKWIADKDFVISKDKLWQEILQHCTIQKIIGLESGKSKRAQDKNGKIAMIRHFIGIREKTEADVAAEEEDADEDDEEEGFEEKLEEEETIAPIIRPFSVFNLVHNTDDKKAVGKSLLDESLIDSNEVDISYEVEEVKEEPPRIASYDFEGKIYWYSTENPKQAYDSNKVKSFKGYVVFLDKDLKKAVGKLMVNDKTGHSTFTLDKMSI